MQSFSQTHFSSRHLVASVVFSGLALAACVGSEADIEAEGDGLDNVEEVQSDSQALCSVDGNLGSACGVIAQSSTKTKGNRYTPTCAYSLSEDAAYTWTAPTTGTYTFSTAGSKFDTVLSILSSGCASNLYCNDDAKGTLQSEISFAATAGTPYVIVVDGYGTKGGDFTLSVTCPPTSCTINGQTYANGALNPANPCQKCNFASSPTSWSNNDGLWEAEGGGGYCKYNICIGGGCPNAAYCSTHTSSCDGVCQGGVMVTDCSGVSGP